MPTRLIDNIWYDSPQPLLTAGESVKQVPYHPDLTTGYAGIAPISANLRVEPSEECDASVPR
ncbi:hypothetical protein FAZ80_16140 [Escherichia coli K-12]|nr:hypothetical protein EPU44_02980 [Escherichia coli]THI77185.1 hypothetical protein FAZ80_16140 [Escherichia coli K-12]